MTFVDKTGHHLMT